MLFHYWYSTLSQAFEPPLDIGQDIETDENLDPEHGHDHATKDDNACAMTSRTESCSPANDQQNCVDCCIKTCRSSASVCVNEVFVTYHYWFNQ